jgi:hypothetical protein
VDRALADSFLAQCEAVLIGRGGGADELFVDHALWPTRGVAEHAYCPRLFYFMTVEGIFAPSADTEQGKGTHRRVAARRGSDAHLSDNALIRAATVRERLPCDGEGW